MNARLLVVDDDPAFCDLVSADLGTRGEFEVVTVTTSQGAWQRLQEEEFDAVITDLTLPGMSGIELCRRLAADRSDIPVIVITGFGSLDSAIQAIRAGAYDFVTKPVEMDQLALVAERAVKHRQLSDEVKRLRRAVRNTELMGPLIGRSEAMKRVYDLVRRLADNTATVLITGESGTGKELVARALHEQGPRRSGHFVAINCAAMPETLLESELFGHVRGAFTDARQDRTGLFVQADGGTLLLDEIGEMPLGTQAKLLRAVQERKVRPVGGNVEIPFDTRIVAATNRELEAEVQARRFREDLYYRINVVKLHLPPLRDRGHDILLLAQHFLERYADRYNAKVVGISRGVAERLLAAPWPGNVRELENCVERAVALARFDHIVLDDLPDHLRETTPGQPIPLADSEASLLPMAEVERRYILHVLDVVGGNKTRAAEILGLDRKTLYRKLERYAEGKVGDDGHEDN